MKPSKKIVVAIIGLLMMIAVGIVLINWVANFFNNFAGYGWDLEAVNTRFDVPLPADAEMIEISGHMGRGGGLNLSFQSSSEAMEEYISIFCNGVFHQGYDPFNAIDIAEPQINTIRISMEGAYFGYTYYSYSPDTPDTVYGTRCLMYDKGQFQITVDKTNNERYSIRLELRYDCPKCLTFWLTPEP